MLQLKLLLRFLNFGFQNWTYCEPGFLLPLQKIWLQYILNLYISLKFNDYGKQYHTSEATKVTMNMTEKTLADIDGIAKLTGNGNRTNIVGTALRVYQHYSACAKKILGMFWIITANSSIGLLPVGFLPPLASNSHKLIWYSPSIRL